MRWSECRAPAKRRAAKAGREAVLAVLLAGGATAAMGAGAGTAPPIRLAGSGENGSGRPNIVLVIVDTLRADHLATYGWPVPTSPNLDATLARRGVVVERAYSQAPWTIPSMVGIMTGRWPGEVIGRTVASYGVPPSVVSLPVALQALGYDTAAFVGNPTIDERSGFARGFGHYYRPESTPEPQWFRADHLTRMVRQWLRARRDDRPFFLYVHYVEPHDPYDSPELVEGRSPYYPEYRGGVSGIWPQGLMLGKIQLRDPVSDVRHLRALYDSEVHWVDRWLGALLAGFDAALQARTFFAFTADHGEELYDHGGWKHGRTVYEEQLRVPLVLRWDGRLPAGRRIAGPIRLIDLAPTLLAATGAPPPPSWQGLDLLPLLRGEEATAPRLPSYAAHFLDGPRRTAAILGRWKLALFDRQAKVTSADDFQARLYRGEMARLPRLALYDLASDPQEKRDVAAAHGNVVAGLGAIIHDHLGREVPGLRVLLAGGTPGTTVIAELAFREPPKGWESCFLAAGDKVELAGNRLRLSLAGEALPKGILLPEGSQITAVAVLAPAGVAVRLGNGIRYRGGTIAASSLRRNRMPPASGAQLLLWQPVRAPTPAVELDPEAIKRLRALGYAG